MLFSLPEIFGDRLLRKKKESVVLRGEEIIEVENEKEEGECSVKRRGEHRGGE